MGLVHYPYHHMYMCVCVLYFICLGIQIHFFIWLYVTRHDLSENNIVLQFANFNLTDGATYSSLYFGETGDCHYLHS